MDWLITNLATIVIGCLLLAAVILAIRSIVKAHKMSSCGSHCTGCSCAEKCPHTK